MKAKISLLALALAGALPLAAMAAPPATPSTGEAPAAQPAVPATPATPATPAGGGSSTTPATPATRAEPSEGIGAAPPLFRQLDTNHDGQISKDEAKANADLRAHFDALDTDRDGKISAAEWNAAQRDGKLGLSSLAK